MAIVVRAEPEQIERAAQILRVGGIVAFPTETVYGLGAVAFDANAVARVFEAKRRPTFDPLIVHIAGEGMLERLVSDVDARARILMERFWPGPLTIVFPKAAAVPDLVTAGLATVAVRCPAHPVARALIEAVGAPLAAPSANAFGTISPTRAEHVAQSLGDAVDLILDGGPTTFGIESTIVEFEGNRATLLRHGAIPLESLEAIVGPLTPATEAANDPRAPGQLRAHYAPRTPLRVVTPATVPPDERTGAGLLAFAESVPGYAAVRILSSAGDVREAAVHLFAALHELDALGLRRIDAEPVPEIGLGRAIADRLRRAARE